jgi:hypothetical protein
VHLKRRIVALGIDDVINVIATYEFSMPVATVVVPVASMFMPITNCGYACHYKLLKNRV